MNETILLRHAAKCVIDTQFGSASMIARVCGVPARKASELMDELEAQGIVGTAVFGKSRDVLVRADELPDILDRIWPLDGGAS